MRWQETLDIVQGGFFSFKTHFLILNIKFNTFLILYCATMFDFIFEFQNVKFDMWQQLTLNIVQGGFSSFETNFLILCIKFNINDIFLIFSIKHL